MSAFLLPESEEFSDFLADPGPPQLRGRCSILRAASRTSSTLPQGCKSFPVTSGQFFRGVLGVLYLYPKGLNLSNPFPSFLFWGFGMNPACPRALHPPGKASPRDGKGEERNLPALCRV